MEVRGYRDEHGFRCAVVVPPCPAVELLLLDDVQGYQGYCQELIAHLDAVQRGDEKSWVGAGNSSTLTIKPDGARIENEYAIPNVDCDLSLEDVRVALVAWLQFLESGA